MTQPRTIGRMMQSGNVNALARALYAPQHTYTARFDVQEQWKECIKGDASVSSSWVFLAKDFEPGLWPTTPTPVNADLDEELRSLVLMCVHRLDATWPIAYSSIL